MPRKYTGSASSNAAVNNTILREKNNRLRTLLRDVENLVSIVATYAEEPWRSRAGDILPRIEEALR